MQTNEPLIAVYIEEHDHKEHWQVGEVGVWRYHDEEHARCYQCSSYSCPHALAVDFAIWCRQHKEDIAYGDISV